MITVGTLLTAGGGGGGNPDLDTVLTAGNISDVAVIISTADASRRSRVLADNDGAEVSARSATTGLVLATFHASDNGYIIYENNTQTAIITFGPGPLVNSSEYNFRDTGTIEDIAFLSDITPAVGTGVFTGTQAFVGAIGGTFNIPHGLGVTPVFATITPKSGAGAVLAPGYVLSYTAALIIITLLVPVAATNFTVDWLAVKP